MSPLFLVCWVSIIKRCCANRFIHPTPCDPIDCSPPGPFDHGILQARILEWVAMPSSRASSWLRDRTVSHALQVNSLPLSHQGSPNRCWILSKALSSSVDIIGAFQVVLLVKNLHTNAEDRGDASPALGSESSLRTGNGNPLQYSLLENPMDRGAWWAIVLKAAELDSTRHIQHFDISTYFFPLVCWGEG